MAILSIFGFPSAHTPTLVSSILELPWTSGSRSFSLVSFTAELHTFVSTHAQHILISHSFLKPLQSDFCLHDSANTPLSRPPNDLPLANPEDASMFILFDLLNFKPTDPTLILQTLSSQCDYTISSQLHVQWCHTVAWSWPRQEYLHHGNQQMPQIRPLFPGKLVIKHLAEYHCSKTPQARVISPFTNLAKPLGDLL